MAHLAPTVTSMTTLLHQEAARHSHAGEPRQRLISARLALIFLASFGTLTSFYLLLSVTPEYAASAGAGSAGAGLVTGALLLGTVAAEVASAALVKRYGYPLVLGAGAVLMGVPALALLFRGSLAVILAVSILRGLGFGFSIVADAAVAELLPPKRRGEGLGLLGVVDSVPAVLALPLGVWLAGHYGFVLVAVLTTATALVALVAVPWMPRRAQIDETTAGHEKPAGMLAALRHGGQLRPFLIFASSTVAAGVIVSFVPLALTGRGSIAATALFAQALAATFSRWWAGRNGDRHGHARLVIPGLALASAGMLVTVWLASPVAVLAGMCLFGVGFGILQNVTLMLMISRVPPSGIATANALWNVAYDAGYGAGPAVFGLFAGSVGYPIVFAMTGVLMLTALPAGLREHRSAR